MNINVKDVVTINNLEYAVAAKLEYDNDIYLYLVSIEETKDIKFCVIKDSDVYEIEDEKLISTLMNILKQQIEK